MPKTVTKVILRGFCDVGIGLAGLVLLVGAVLMLTWTVGLLTCATQNRRTAERRDPARIWQPPPSKPPAEGAYRSPTAGRSRHRADQPAVTPTPAIIASMPAFT